MADLRRSEATLAFSLHQALFQASTALAVSWLPYVGVPARLQADRGRALAQYVSKGEDPPAGRRMQMLAALYHPAAAMYVVEISE
jgi:hypothetical protein